MVVANLFELHASCIKTTIVLVCVWLWFWFIGTLHRLSSQSAGRWYLYNGIRSSLLSEDFVTAILYTALSHIACNLCLGVCNHAFHFHCISRWLKTSQVCPLDNTEWEFDWQVDQIISLLIDVTCFCLAPNYLFLAVFLCSFMVLFCYLPVWGVLCFVINELKTCRNMRIQMATHQASLELFKSELRIVLIHYCAAKRYNITWLSISISLSRCGEVMACCISSWRDKNLWRSVDGCRNELCIFKFVWVKK